MTSFQLIFKLKGGLLLIIRYFFMWKKLIRYLLNILLFSYIQILKYHVYYNRIMSINTVSSLTTVWKGVKECLN